MPRRLVTLLGLMIALAATAACNKTSDSPAAPSQPPGPGTTVYYTAIGASDASGVGSSVPCAPFVTDCPNGMGYVPVIVRQLQAQGATVTLSNLGIPATVIGPDFQALGAQYGRTIPGNFIDQEAPFVPRNSTIVTIFAGGNDVNTVVAAVGGGAGGSNIPAYVDQQIRAFGTDYAALLKIIRDRAPSARIIVANLPNFAGIPMTAGYTLDRRQLMQKVSVGFDTQVVNPLASQGIAVVDLLCNPRFSDPSIFSSDGFHPNDTGYAILASEMMRAIATNGFPAPSSSCSQMQIVPPI
ncbi:MAG TPA: SGNH/GDSL hydrolase family protein [Vicinamibacterales bacterium]